MEMARPRSIKKNTVYNALKTFSSILFPLIVFPYISRVLGAESYGKINFGASIISYFSLVATLGITAYAVRECSKIKDDRNELSRVASQIFSINILTTIIAYFLLVICLFFVKNLQSYILLLVIQGVSIGFTAIGADWLNTAMEDFRYITIRTFAFQLIAIVCVFFFVSQPEDYYIYAVISLISSGGAQLANVLYRRRFCEVRFTRCIEFRKHMPPILLLFVMLLSQQILNHLDITMLGFIRGDREVGLYSTALKIYNIITQMILSITWVVLPGFSIGFKNRDYVTINGLLRYVTEFTIVFGVPCFAGMFILADDIIMLIAGREYCMASNCLRILAVSMIFMFLINIFGNLILLSQGKDKKFTKAWLFAMVFNIVSNAFVIPVMGLNGAALTTMLANLIVVIISVLNIEKEISFGDKKSLFFAPLFGSALIVIICAVSSGLIDNPVVTFFVSVFLSTVVYITILLMFRYPLMISIVNKGLFIFKTYSYKQEGE